MVKPNIDGANKILFYGFLLMFCMLVAFNIIWYNQSHDLYRQIATLKVGNYTEEGRPYDLSYPYVNDLLEQCNHYDSLTFRMECIVEYNHKFKYLSRKDLKPLSVEDLIEEGGDCESWASFYEAIAKHYNYSFTPILVPINDSRYHRFSIIYNDFGYCYVDMLHVECVDYDFS